MSSNLSDLNSPSSYLSADSSGPISPSTPLTPLTSLTPIEKDLTNPETKPVRVLLSIEDTGRRFRYPWSKTSGLSSNHRCRPTTIRLTPLFPSTHTKWQEFYLLSDLPEAGNWLLRKADLTSLEALDSAQGREVSEEEYEKSVLESFGTRVDWINQNYGHRVNLEVMSKDKAANEIREYEETVEGIPVRSESCKGWLGGLKPSEKPISTIDWKPYLSDVSIKSTERPVKPAHLGAS